MKIILFLVIYWLIFNWKSQVPHLVKTWFLCLISGLPNLTTLVWIEVERSNLTSWRSNLTLFDTIPHHKRGWTVKLIKKNISNFIWPPFLTSGGWIPTLKVESGGQMVCSWNLIFQSIPYILKWIRPYGGRIHLKEVKSII